MQILANMIITYYILSRELLCLLYTCIGREHHWKASTQHWHEFQWHISGDSWSSCPWRKDSDLHVLHQRGSVWLLQLCHLIRPHKRSYSSKTFYHSLRPLPCDRLGPDLWLQGQALWNNHARVEHWRLALLWQHGWVHCGCGLNFQWIWDPSQIPLCHRELQVYMIIVLIIWDHQKYFRDVEQQLGVVLNLE